MCEIEFEGEGPSLREVHEQITSEEEVTFRQQYPGEYAATVRASGFKEFILPQTAAPTTEHLEAIGKIFGLQAYFGPREETGVALSGLAIYYQAHGPVKPVHA